MKNVLNLYFTYNIKIFFLPLPYLEFMNTEHFTPTRQFCGANYSYLHIHLTAATIYYYVP